MSGPLARSIGRWTLRVLAAIAVVAFLWVAWIAAHIVWYRFQPPGETAFMAQRMDELRAKNAKAVLQYRWVPYARISTQLKRAMIAAEDARFTEHGGFDWDGISNAFEKNRKSGRVVGGGSTITQQLAKNLFLSPARSYWRKAEEAVVTVLLEAMLPKQRILELYLNVIEWGNGVFGAEAAAQRYFGVGGGATLRGAGGTTRGDDARARARSNAGRIRPISTAGSPRFWRACRAQ